MLQRFSALTASSTYVLKMLPNPGTPANVIAFHPYNPKIVVAGNNHIQMWDIEKGKCGKHSMIYDVTYKDKFRSLSVKS